MLFDINSNVINLGNGFGIQITFQNLINQNFINQTFGNILSSNFGGVVNNFTDDVVTTLQEEDLKNLKKFKTDRILDEKCSICMSNIIVDEEVCQLPCKHEFHNECIEPWLKEYNYKCPICRMEVGKPKHNI